MPADNNINLDANAVDAPIDIQKPASGGALTPGFLAVFANTYNETKQKTDEIAANIKVRQSEIAFLQSVIQDINSLIDDKGNLDMTKNEALQTKLLRVREIGKQLEFDNLVMMGDKSSPEKPQLKLKLTTQQTNSLIDNLNHAIGHHEKTNQHQLEQMRIHHSHSDKFVTLATNIMKIEHQAIRSTIQSMK